MSERPRPGARPWITRRCRRLASTSWIAGWVASCSGCLREPPPAQPALAASVSPPSGRELRTASTLPPVVDRRVSPMTMTSSSEDSWRSLELGGALLRVKLDAPRFELGADVLLDWVLSSARAIQDYYGVFPVPEAELVVHAAPGRGVHGGHTAPAAVPRIDISVGVRATRGDLRRNWSLAHEFVHLALPNLRRRHHWLEEGLASYVEPIARARAGLLDEADVWREWLGRLELGQPDAGDRGLDRTPTWARTYWGGALFCFQADLAIRQRSAGRFELRDALRGILAAGGNITVNWPIERVLHAGDAAVGAQVLEELYARVKDRPERFDLRGAWRDLGVSEQAGELRFDDSAPLAGMRSVFVRGR